MSDKLILGIVAILAVTLFGMASVCMITADVECANSQDLAEDWIHQSNCDAQIATAVSVNATAIEATNEAIDEDHRIPDNEATAYANFWNLDRYYDEALATANAWFDYFGVTATARSYSWTATAKVEYGIVTAVPTEVPVETLPGPITPTPTNQDG